MNPALYVLDWWCRSWRLRSYVSGSLPHPAVVAMWHDEMLPVWRFFASVTAAALISYSRDGEWLARLLRRWRYTVVRGSRHRGGKEALHRLAALARQYTVLITPDGSRGPRHRFKPGAVVLAHRTQRPLLLCRIRARGIRFSRSWDRFLLPYPFAHIELFFSPPIRVPQDASPDEIDRWIQQCEQWLNLPPERLPECATS